MKNKTTKRALLSSVLSLFLCFVMLMGTTFAWFTDSVTSAGNVIQAGNLDVVVQYTLDGEKWEDLQGANDLFQKSLWEPGHTEVIALRIENKGTLALKYNAHMNILNETVGKTKDGKDIVLSEILTVGTLVQEANQIGDIAVALAFKNENMYKGTTTFKASNILESNRELLPGAAHYAIIKVDMPETVGNEANHNGVDIPSIEFGINVYATQFTYENDSFGNQYDKDAAWDGTIPTTKPDSLVVDTTAKLISINDADAFAYLNTLLNDGNFVANYGAKWQYSVELNCDINLLGNEWTPIILSNVVAFDGKGHTISNLKITSGNDSVGLFGALACNDLGYGTIKNLTVDGAFVKGGNSSGVLVGISHGTIENATVLNATIEANKYVGGLAGRTGNVKNCTIKNSTVVGNDKTVGGLVGYCIEDPGTGSATGNTVEDVTVTGTYNVGGMLGQAQNVTVEGNTVKNCVVSSVKPLPDDASSNEVRVAELAARCAFSTTVIGQNTIENVVAAEIVYIYNLNDFAEFGKAVTNNTKYNGSIVANNPKVWVEVMSDIDMTNAPGFQGGQFSIGNGNNNQFQGVFDGNDHTISNYTIIGSWTYNVSLFRTVSGNFTMKDITFDNCSATKPNNRLSSILVGTIGGGTITFDNVDIKNSTSSGVAGAAIYVGKITEGALYFIDCDVDNSTVNASSASATNAVFLCGGYSHHDYAESGVWVENCTVANTKSVINGVEEATVKEYNYTK